MGNLGDLLNLGTAQNASAGEDAAFITRIGKVGDGRRDAIHKGNGDDLESVSCRLDLRVSDVTHVDIGI